LYYQRYRDQHPDQASVTRKRCGLNIKVNITANVWASMSKKEIAKIHVREQEAKKKIQHDDLYGSDTSSHTADLFDHQDYKYVMVHKMSKLKEGANPNPVCHTSFKNYYNSAIMLLNYHVHVKNNKSACKYHDTKGNYSIIQFLNLVKNRRTTTAKLSFDNKLKDGYSLFDLLNKLPDIEEKLWLSAR
jgi:hypothetical protein